MASTANLEHGDRGLGGRFHAYLAGAGTCGSCVDRGEITACSYASRTSHDDDDTRKPSDPSEAAQKRIDDLEKLVLRFLENRHHEPGEVGTSATCNDAVAEDTARSKLVSAINTRQNNSRYIRGHLRKVTNEVSRRPIQISAEFAQRHSVDDGYWTLLLEQIGEVRLHLQSAEKQYEAQAKRLAPAPLHQSGDAGPTLLFSSARITSRADILVQIPSKYICDMLLTRFFDHMFPAIHILHEPTFNKQYVRFWADRANTPMAWVALMFAVLRIAVVDYLREEDEPLELAGKCQDLAGAFRDRLADCLILADYLQPQEFLIEALSLHMYGEYISSRDAKSSVWVLNGLVVRLAMRMGYHQPLQPGLTTTPFHTEMRKRVWTFIRQADILIAFQAGMPSMIELPVDESSMPGNFYDDEAFGEECTALPEVLPDSEPTQVSFLIAKSRMAFGFALALKEVSSTAKIRSERILELDRDLRNLYNNVPEKYQLRQLSTQDSLILTSARFVLAGIHHKSLCVIHSRFLEVAGDNDNCAYSRRVCLSSAMSILRFQVIQNEKLPINGRLRSITNYQNSLTIHDYLLAATIISAELCSGTDFGAPTEQASTQGELSRSNMIRALRSCARIFSQTKDRSMEAYKAADILHMLIQKFRSTRSASQRSAAGSDETQSSPAVVSIGEKFNPFTPNLQSLIRAPGSVHNNISSSLAGGESTGHDRMANDSDSEFCNFQLGAANDTFAEETNVDLSATKWSIGDWRTINESFDPPWAFPQADTELGDIASWIRSGNF